LLTCRVFLSTPPESGAADRTPVSLDPGFGLGGVQDQHCTPRNDHQDTGKQCEVKSGLAERHRRAGRVLGLHLERLGCMLKVKQAFSCEVRISQS
jgi:hypothetical protein